MISAHRISSDLLSSHLPPPPPPASQAALLEALDDAELRELVTRAGFVNDIGAAATRAELLVRAA